MNCKLIFVLSTFIGANAIRFSWEKFPSEMDTDTDGNGPPCRKQPWAATECGANDRFSMEEMKSTLGEYKDIWARHPGGGKLSVNHQFAEWFLIKTLKPSVIVESGVLHGQATWALREAAGPDARIFSFDPVDQTKLGFRDTNPNTKYLTGKNWKDLTVIDMDSIGLSKEDRANAVVILDDHQIFLDRFKTLKELGFKHVFVEDNNKYGFGNTGPNFFCTKPELYNDLSYAPPTYRMDKIIYANSLTGSAVKAGGQEAVINYVTWDEHKENSKWLQDNIKTYFEFPAVYDLCNTRPNILENKQMLKDFGLPGANFDTYQHRFPAYVEIA